MSSSVRALRRPSVGLCARRQRAGWRGVSIGGRVWFQDVLCSFSSCEFRSPHVDVFFYIHLNHSLRDLKTLFIILKSRISCLRMTKILVLPETTWEKQHRGSSLWGDRKGAAGLPRPHCGPVNLPLGSEGKEDSAGRHFHLADWKKRQV